MDNIRQYRVNAITWFDLALKVAITMHWGLQQERPPGRLEHLDPFWP